ncbi:MAG: hypothetical protein CO118_03475 [Flavobacteriales bacterium CG_4_9_14_3_um_filter_32_8]|nr:MAG: hypothetical protein CO118_03475 [Flavobacteriales bacterium CG_4_9_14_3_um_filter_32_8]
MHLLKKILFLFIFLFGSFSLFAQNINVNASIDTNFLLIGEQTQITLKVQYRLDGEPVVLKFPELKDTISTKAIEIVYSSAVDTSYPDKNDLSLVEQTKKITITSFDSGYYEIPYFEFIINNQTYQTGPLQIQVQPMEVDTAKAIFDIKEPLEEPFSIIDWLKENWVWIAIVLVLLIGFIVLYRYLKNRPEPIVEEIVPEIPYYIITLEKLEKLKEDKLWQAGKVKLHHSEISEILREYLEKRYEVKALEHTTDEIIQSLRFHPIDANLLSQLNQLLILADMVKFAKEQPLPEENDRCLNNAIEFVNHTKLIIVPKVEDAK